MSKLKQSMQKLLGIFAKKCILFESSPDYSDNTMAVFCEMVKRGMDRKYHLIWSLSDGTYALYDKGVFRAVDPYKRDTLAARLFNLSFANTCFIVYCNVNPNVFDPQPPSFYLSHGTAIKSIKNYYKEGESATYCLSASEGVADIASVEFKVAPERVVSLGFPRNDVLTSGKEIKSLLGWGSDKLVIWYPTYRQRVDGKVFGGSVGIPIINDAENARKLNDFAASRHVRILIKPHFVQITSYITDQHLDHVVLVDESLFEKHGFSSYELLSGSDALITDFSSVYYDYTLCDKPICAVWEDLEAYRADPGFAVDVDQMMSGAEKAYTLQDLETFIGHVADGKDVLRDERRKIRDLANYSTDGCNSRRVVDFIESELGKRKQSVGR